MSRKRPDAGLGSAGLVLLSGNSTEGLQEWRPPIVRVMAHRGPGEQSAGLGGHLVCLRTAAVARGNCWEHFSLNCSVLQENHNCTR